MSQKTQSFSKNQTFEFIELCLYFLKFVQNARF